MVERDSLIQKLAEEASSQHVTLDPTIAQFKAELETVESQIRQPAPIDPVADESECQEAVGRIIEMGRDLSAATREALRPPSSAPQAVLIGTLGQYQLLEKLGEGGMGAVYKAVHSRLERVVAVKVLPANRLQDPQAVGRFQREMRAVGKLQHPNIVAAHDAGEIDGTHYLVMELVEGIDLGKLVSRRGPLPINAACELIRQAALGLQHAYEHNLVHRDIKPSNLMLAAPSNSKALPTVKILDLGLALLEGGQVEANELTSTGQVMGTIDYMAPEQGTDTHGVDIRADIYSLGATLYKLLSGQAPFSDPQYATPIKKLMALATKAPKPIESLRPDCPPQLAQLVGRMLAKPPEERPTPPEELASLLEPFANGADLRGLLTAVDGTRSATIPRQDSAIVTQQTADDPTFLVASQPAGSATVSQPAPPRSKRRLWLIGGGAFASILAAIIAISVNKGEGTIEIDAPDDLIGQVRVNVVSEGRNFEGWQLKPGGGNTLTVRSGNVDVTLPDDSNEYELKKPNELVVRRGKTVVFTLQRKHAPVSVDLANIQKSNVSAPAVAPDPPPLDEWLKGRTVLTVAQDGSGQFKTIQEALKSLKPHEVIKVLDAGPYREPINSGGLPPDTGLITAQQTVLDVGETLAVFGPLDGFRISGFRIVGSPLKEYGGLLLINRASGLVLEDCSFALTKLSPDTHRPGVAFADSDSDSKPSFIRHCMFDSQAMGVTLNEQTGPIPELVVERSYFKCTGMAVTGPRLRNLVVRHNVFDSTNGAMWIGNLKQIEGRLEISNNTTKSSNICSLDTTAPHQGMVIYNNISEITACHIDPQADLTPASAQKNWDMDYNNYVRRGRLGKAEHDVIADPQFLSSRADDRDYLRIPADTPLVGVGGKWPSYMGALPPGSAPKDGDWFTRLRERWLAADFHKTSQEVIPPIAIVEPPSLEDWLKGRTVLTVAQDGSGQFKTIRDALNAVQSGQIIKVLDKGPYRERLTLSSPPPDIGLVSAVQTTIELPEYVASANETDRRGHVLDDLDRFRWNGFEFLLPLPPPEQETIQGLSFGRPQGVVFENCAVRCPKGRINPGLVFGSILASPDLPNVIRDCLIEARIQAYSLKPENSFIATRNFITGESWCGLAVAGKFQSCSIRHNIFGTSLYGGHDLYVIHADWYDLTNNTFLTFPGAVKMDSLSARRQHEAAMRWLDGAKDAIPEIDRGFAPTGRGAIYNNLHHRAGFLNITGGGEKGPWTWQVGYNCYPGDGEIAAENAMPRATNSLATPIFYSVLPEDPQFARLKPDSPGATAGAGGEWPTYAGALPPGPEPKEGDWFTRLRQRWASTQATGTLKPQLEIARSAPIVEPPPLEEWLKGRTILTVAQDGSGQFKTIQDALNVMQSGDAVEVLDRGPYLEQLDLKCPPDSGLISKVQTVIAPLRATLAGDGRSVGHYFRRTNGFRLHGFAFRLPEIKDQLGLVCDDRPDGLLIEQCQFRASHLATLSAGCAAVYLHSGPKGVSRPTIIRNCRFDGRLMINGEDNVEDRDVLVLRNYFTGHDSELTPLVLIRAFRRLEVRENVIKGSAVSFSTLEGSQTIEVSRNTFVDDMNLSVFGSMPERMKFEGNLVCDYGKISVASDLPTERVMAWQLKQNYFQGELGDWPGTIRVPMGPTDRVAPIRLLSKIPGNRDYLRLPFAQLSDDKAVPTGVGALPQGPAPDGGDWFSRLQESWLDAAPSSP